METVNNPIQACNDIFLKPNRVFATLQNKHNWSWLPFFIVIIMSIAPSYLYFSFVDFEWYRELIISNTMADVSPAEQNQMRAAMTQQGTILFTIFGGLVGFVAINAVIATYLNLVTKSDENNLNGFTDWYGLTWWTSMPVILSSVIAIAMILLATDNQLPPENLSLTSLSFILGIGLDSSWFGLAQNIRVESFWSAYLMAVGISQWTQIEGKKAMGIAIAPLLVIWGIWAVAIIA